MKCNCSFLNPVSHLLLQIEELMSRALIQWGTMLWHEKLTQLEWDEEVVKFLTNKVRRNLRL